MKKKDLVPGTIYATKWGIPYYLLLSVHVWRKPYSSGTKPTSYLLQRAGSKPQKGIGFTDQGQGVLVLNGDVVTMRKALKEHAELFRAVAALEPDESGSTDHTEVVSELMQALRASYPDEGLYTNLENYQRWPGTYEQVQEQRDQESAQLKAGWDELGKRRDAAAERSLRIEGHLRALLGDSSHFPRDYEQVTSTNGAHTSRIVSGLTLSFEELERLIILAERGSE